jgi:hypothetical protein
VSAAPDFPAQDRELCDRMRQYLGHIQDMPAQERLHMLGALHGALERHLAAPAAPLMRPGRTLSQTPGLCTLYRVTGDDWERHECVGLVTSPEVAKAICDAVTARGVPLPAVPGLGDVARVILGDRAEGITAETTVAGIAALLGLPDRD